MTETPPGDIGVPIRLLLVDHRDLFRTGLASLLAADGNIEIVAQASTARHGVRLATELMPDVIVTDLNMPDIDGIEAITAIMESNPAARVIVLTVASAESDISAAVFAGACGYLIKDSPIEDISAAIHAASRGESWLSPRAAAALLDRVRRQHIVSTPDPGGLADLTPRELEVLRLVARCMNNAEIADVLGISTPTAKNYLTSILHKLGMHKRIEAAIFAVRRGLD
jgi:DNA-binding NarL/FixJ family response regulator